MKVLQIMPCFGQSESVLLGDKPQGISYLPISTPRIVGMALVEREGKTELGWITWTPETCEITISTGPGRRQGRNLTAVEPNKGNYFYDSSPVL